LSFLRRLFIISFPTFILLLLLLEGLLRATGYVPYFQNALAFAPSNNPVLLYSLRPNFSGLYAGVPIHINSQGFRGKELSHQNDSSAFRVVIAGDSIAFGQGVSEGETLAEQLNADLQRKHGSNVEVINLGVPGYDTCQEDLKFREDALPLKPRILILLYCENDVDPGLITVKNGVVISSDVRTGLFGDLMAGARKHCDVYNFVWARWQVLKSRKLSVTEYSAILARKYDENYPGWKRSKACLADLASLAKAQSIRVIVIPFPTAGGLRYKPYPFAGYIKTVCAAAQADDAECLDVVPSLQDPLLRVTVSNIENHPSAEVYAKVAERLESIIP